MIIAVVLIIAVGPDKMPSVLKTVVKGFRDFQKATTDLRNAVNIDQILDLEPKNPRRVLAPVLALSEYERQRENPRFGPDLEHAMSLQTEFAGDLRREFPPEGADVAYASLPPVVEGAVPVA